MGTRSILQVLKMFPVFFPVPVQVHSERFLLKPYNPFLPGPGPCHGPGSSQCEYTIRVHYPAKPTNETSRRDGFNTLGLSLKADAKLKNLLRCV